VLVGVGAGCEVRDPSNLSWMKFEIKLDELACDSQGKNVRLRAVLQGCPAAVLDGRAARSRHKPRAACGAGQVVQFNAVATV
jgi:hypothetical protein